MTAESCFVTMLPTRLYTSSAAALSAVRSARSPDENVCCTPSTKSSCQIAAAGFVAGSPGVAVSSGASGTNMSTPPAPPSRRAASA